MKVTTQQLATYIVRDGARLHHSDDTRRILGESLHVYRVPMQHGHLDVIVTDAQRDEVWSIIDRMPVR